MVAGRAGVALVLERAAVRMGGIELFGDGVPYNDRAPAAAAHLAGAEIKIEIDLGTGAGQSGTIWTCDLSADYVRTAFAKGLREKRVVWLHVMRNSLIPIAATIGHIVSILLAGSYLIEVATNIDGFGMLGYRSVLERDFTVIMGVLVIGVFLRLIGNILSDVALATIDPRIVWKD